MRLLPVALLLFSVLSSSVLPANARPRDDAEVRRFEHRDPNRSRQTGTAGGAFGTAQAETTYFGGTFWGLNYNNHKPEPTLRLDKVSIKSIEVRKVVQSD